MIFYSLQLFIIMFLYLFYRLRDYLFPMKRFRSKTAKEMERTFYRSQPKPQWVKQEVMKLKAIMPHAGCRTVADIFNRMFFCKDMSIGKSFVHDIFQRHEFQIQVLRRKIKNARPKPITKNLIWGMDLTGKTDNQGCLHYILGMVEHASRASLCLMAVKDKSAVTLLHHLLNVVERFGKPKILRTDNEQVFASWLFKIVLRLLGIKHQPIQPGCPWQNGRIERFLGTLKEKLNHIEVYSKEGLNDALMQFRFWYNHVRPHQNLDGRTPAEVWANRDVFKQQPKRKYWFEAWEGLLTGIYLKL